MPRRVVPWTLFFFLVLVAVFLGNRLGELLAGQAAWLGRSYALQLGPVHLAGFDVIRFDLGLAVDVNPMGGLAGLITAFLVRTRVGA